jgi:hypothetical protein
MNQVLHRSVSRLAAMTLVGVAALFVLTACAGSPERPMPAAGDTAGMAGAPPPQAPQAPQDKPEQAPQPDRDVVRTASMSIIAGNVSEAADKAAVIVETAGGRVDSRSEDAGSNSRQAQTSVVLRVPAPKLDGVVRELKALGDVQHAETTAEDVTSQRVDLDARIKALQTSVDRLLAIMRDARDPEALIQAENALSERQADLDSLRAQREALGDRVEYSTVNVTFTAEQIGGPAPKEYEGFLGQIERGWDGLLWVVRSAVLLFGLLLPWLGALAFVVGLCYGAVRLMRARRS